MSSQKLDNIRIDSFTRLISPSEIRQQIPIGEKASQTISQGRNDFCKVLNDEDDRFVVIVGPCSIHDPKAAIEYAKKLKKLNNELSDKLLIMMRVYFEKPRTTTGWKGFINDPFLNNTRDIGAGINLARELLIEIADLGLAPATELLDPITAAYVGELVSWAAIGARTTESQTHRQMTSGLSAPIGFKNNCDGNLDIAINAMKSAKSPHSFLGIDDVGHCCILKTTGNADTHIILRGGNGRPNHHREDITECEEKLSEKGSQLKIMVDCSHENSSKDHTKQRLVVKDILTQKQEGNKSIFGLMLESNLGAGNQKMTENIDDLEYGVSITDACIDWEETEELLRQLHSEL